MTAAVEILPERIAGADGLLLRRWVPEDAEALSAAVAESLAHLRPWMAWVAHEPVTIEERRMAIVAFEQKWRAGGDAVLGLFLDDRVAGGCGLHRRIAPDGLELGYWIHPGFTRQGLATAAARLMADTALSLPGITHVEIHHDKANVASAGVPKKLGFRLLAEVPDEPEGPADVGIECQWRMDRERWRGLRA